jgi:U3 small nucleolar RNA-associated protein 12
MIPHTKQFITCSKDKTIKYWDAEKFQELQKITAHQGEIWAICINQSGTSIVSVSKDRSIRVWKSGSEMLFPDEERELELESQFEKSLLEDNKHEQETPSETDRAPTKTLTSMKAGERVMECIEAADDERRKWDEYHTAKSQGLASAEPTPGAFFLALGRDKTPSEFVMSAFERIPLPDIEEALLCLPTKSLPSLLYYLHEWLKGRRNVVLSSRILDLILRLFHRSIIANSGLRVLLESIRDTERETLKELKNVIGFNNVCMQMA